MATTEPSADADLTSLRDERAFLFRSLADLDAEHEAGDIEDSDYQALTDEYTARAAAVLRAIEAAEGPGRRKGTSPGANTAPPPGATAAPAGRRRPAAASAAVDTASSRRATTASPALGSPPVTAASSRRTTTAPARRRRRTIAVLVAVAAFGAVTAWAVTQSSGGRQAGQTITGNGQITGTTAVAGGIDPRLVTAANDVNKGQVADALKVYDAILKDDPNQPVALADGGWLEAQAGLAANRSDLVDSGLTKIQQAEKIDSSFADPHFFRGFLLLRAKNDPAGAVTELRTYLGTVNPSAPQVASVQALLQEAIKAAGTNVPAGPNAPTTSTSAVP
ncbi:MAG TPA: hypothetical protein VHT75_15140 [Acidimicrobiales bacterium]|jgi:hypothetical protein|nr:hypothetical protein [Acidimicrobiales bacterium]